MPAKQLTVTYGADASHLKRATKEIEDAHSSMGSKISSVGNGMVNQFGRLGNAFGINLGPIKGIANQAEGAIGGLGSSIGGLVGPVGIGIGAAVGLALAYKGAADTAASVAGEIRKLQAITGASAEDASRLRHEFVHFGVDADTGGAALVKFSRNLEEGTGKFKQWFTEADMAKLKGQSLIQDLPLLAQKYQALGTAVEKNAFLLDTFGKSGTVLRPILSANADELVRVGKEADKLGLTFSQKGLEAAKQYTIAQRDLGEALKGIQVTAGQSAIPAITNFVHALTTGIEKIREVNGFIERMDHGLGGLGTILGGPIAWGMKAWHLATGDNTKAIQGQRQALEADNAAVEDNAKAAEAATKAAQKFADTIIKSFNAVSSAADGTGFLTQATAAMGKADDKAAADRQKLNELVADGVINTKALDAATKAIETTSRATESAQVALVKAGDSVTTSLKKEADAARALQILLGGPSSKDQAKAEEDIGKAKINTTRASLSLQDAIDAEMALKASGTATDRQLLDAELAVQSARYGSVDAADAQKTAEQTLYDLQHAADAGSVQRVTLEDNLKAAHDAVTDSVRAQTDATRAVRDAQLAEVDAAKALQIAQAPDEALLKGIADAQRQLANDINTVGTTSAKVATSFAEFKNQLIKNIADMNAWADNLQFLMDNKVSQAILEPLAQMGPKAGPLLQQLRDEVTKHGTGAVNDLGAHLQTATDHMNQTLSDTEYYWSQHPLGIKANLQLGLDNASLAAVGGAIGGAIAGQAKIRGFDAGGTIPGPIGTPQLILAHAGEEINPIGSGTGNSGGNTYIVNVNVGGSVTSERNLTNTIYEQLLEFKRRQGTLGLS